MEPETDHRRGGAAVSSRPSRRRLLPLLAVSSLVGALVVAVVERPERAEPPAEDLARGVDRRGDAPPALGAVSAEEPWRALVSADGSSVGNRHETSAVALNGRIYVLGGRGRRSARVFDAAARTWRALPDLPLEMHHFQPVAVGNTIYAIAAMTCCFPQEPGVATVHVFDTITERWSTAGEMPPARVRGGAGAVVHGGLIYLVGGNTLGHSGGAVPWLDRYDPATGRWDVLPDAPTARDHFQAALVDGRIVAAGGRQSAMPSPQSNTVRATDVYDIAAGRWESGRLMPTARGGTVSVAHDGEAIVLGGEIATSGPALDKVEAYDLASDSWRTLSPLLQGRHGSGAVVIGDTLHIVAGSLHRGGAPETDSHETLALDDGTEPDPDRDGDGLDDVDETALHGTDPDDPDTDDDGLDDGRELALGTDPLTRDSDADGLADGSEVDEHGTDPVRADHDDDGLSDGAEIDVHGTDPTRADSDGDGLSDGVELETHGTDPMRADSDGDGLPDGAEADVHGTDPTRPDTDADGTDDGEELALGRDPVRADAPDDTPTPAPVPASVPVTSPDRTPLPVPTPVPTPVIDDPADDDVDPEGSPLDTPPSRKSGGGSMSGAFVLFGLLALGRGRSARRRPTGRRLRDA